MVALIVYTDGSQSTKKEGVGWGMVLAKNTEDYQPIYEENGLITDPLIVPLQNVAGEVMAAIKAVQVTMQTGVKIRIIYDFEGVEYWVTGKYKTKSGLSEAYKQIAKPLYDKGLIEFQKVKAHSNNPGNDRADKLAKLALEGVFVNESK